MGAFGEEKHYVALLFESFMQMEGNRFSPLSVTAKQGYEDTARMLLDQGASVENADLYGYTALFYSCQNGHAGLTKSLLDYGANSNAKNKFGETPLF